MAPGNHDLPAAPRHLRRRRFWQPATNEGFGGEKSTQQTTGPINPAPASKGVSQRAKRAVALMVVVAVSVAIPALIWALVFWQ